MAWRARKIGANPHMVGENSFDMAWPDYDILPVTPYGQGGLADMARVVRGRDQGGER